MTAFSNSPTASPAAPGTTSATASATASPATSPATSPARSPRWLTVVGVLGVMTMGLTVWLGLWITPPDVIQGNLARLLYIHPPIATVALYWAGGVAAAGSLLYLWPRTRSFFWDRLAASAVEVGAVFSALTLVTGSLWGRPVWGVWWTWDARLTSTALLLLLELGYLALRRVPADPAIRARRCAVAALLVAVDVPIVHFSVNWWQTLHQGGTILDPGFNLHVHGSMLWTLGVGFIAFSLIFVWLLGVRYRIEVLQDEVGDQELEISLTERWEEGTELAGVAAAPTGAPTAAPTGASTAAPTGASTAAPTGAPTAAPTGASTAAPTGASTATPTGASTATPTGASTAAPTGALAAPSLSSARRDAP